MNIIDYIEFNRDRKKGITHFSEFNALKGFEKVFKCYESVFKNADKYIKNGTYDSKIAACDAMHNNWINLNMSKKYSEPHFINTLSLALQFLVSSDGKEKADKLTIFSTNCSKF